MASVRELITADMTESSLKGIWRYILELTSARNVEGLNWQRCVRFRLWGSECLRSTKVVPIVR